MALILLAFPVAVGAASLISYVSRLQIQSIEVSGVKSLSSEIVRAHTESILYDGKWRLFSRRNIILYPRGEITRSLMADFPYIKTADVSRRGLFSHTLIVQIDERVPATIWCPDSLLARELPQAVTREACYVMDETGFIFAAAPESASALPRYSGALADGPIGATLQPEYFKNLQETFFLFAERNPTGIHVIDQHDFTIAFADGWYVKASLDQPGEVIVGNLETVLSSEALKGREGELEYIDLRFGNRVYYTFK
jgi:cell division septal protein FtsQ